MRHYGRTMTVAPDLLSFVPSLCDICLATAILGCIVNLIESAFVLGFPKKEKKGQAAQPAVTVLKPLHGTEPELDVRLAAFCGQEYGGPVQVLCGTQNRDLSTLAVADAEDAQGLHPTLELAVDPRSHGSNRKVSNLINMLPRARHDTLVLSDSDIVVEPNYLRDITAPLASPQTGVVSCLYYGIGGEDVWARLLALAINTHFLPLAIMAVRLRLTQPCCGATIALRRSTLERIGGFGILADVLADDHAIGVAARAAGYDVVTAPFLVGHRCFEASFGELVRQQIRVARTIKSIDPIGYAGTLLANPWPLALIAALTGGSAGALTALAALLTRALLCRCVERRFALPRQDYRLLPLHDFIVFGVYVASFFGATVHWRGADYRVSAEGALIEQQDLSRSSIREGHSTP